MIQTDYNGETYTVPETGRGASLDALSEIPSDDYAMAYLLQDGNYSVPGSRYGRDTEDCAPVALALAKIMSYHSGDPMTYYALDSDMGLVVNSSDDVAEMIRNYGALVGVDPADLLSEEDMSDDLSGTFVLRIELGNAEMCSALDLAGALENIARDIRDCDTSGNIYDVNGNNVGSYEIQ